MLQSMKLVNGCVETAALQGQDCVARRENQITCCMTLYGNRRIYLANGRPDGPDYVVSRS